MAKSKATFNKKEKEKQRLKKRKEKAEKKEERKANSKSKDFDDMIAYVDEYGVISSTPPEKTDKKGVNKEDIQISIPKQEHVKEDSRREGVVSFFNNDKGFGFITDAHSGEKIFVHITDIVDEVKENDRVNYKTEYSHKGIAAVDVRK